MSTKWISNRLYFSYPAKRKCVQGYTGIGLSVRSSVCLSVYKILVSVDNGSCVVQWYTIWPVIQGYWVGAALDPQVFFVVVFLGKTLPSPSLVLVKPRKGINNTSCLRDMTEILLKRGKTLFNQYNILLFGRELTRNHTIPHFDALKIRSCGKHCEKRRNCF